MSKVDLSMFGGTKTPDDRFLRRQAAAIQIAAALISSKHLQSGFYRTDLVDEFSRVAVLLADKIISQCEKDES